MHPVWLIAYCGSAEVIYEHKFKLYNLFMNFVCDALKMCAKHAIIFIAGVLYYVLRKKSVFNNLNKIIGNIF